MVANLIFHKYQWQKSSSFMLISESSYTCTKASCNSWFIRFSPFFFLSTYKRLFNNELYSFIERGKSNISIDTQCKEIRAESLNNIVINRRICRHPESLQLMRVLSGCQGLLFVKPPLKPTFPTFSLHVLWLRLLYVLLFPSVDRRWCYVSDFVVNVSGACQAACTALQCCWHLWDYSPPPIPVPFYLTEGLSTCIMLLHGHPILSNRSRKWKDYGLIGGRWLLFRTRPLLAWIFQYNRNIDNNWVGIF